MPIYEYKCEDCSQIFEELLLSRAEQFSIVCKHCGSANVTKLMSGAAVHSAGGSSDMPDCAAMCDRASSACCGGACSGHGGGFDD